jgi:ATP-dependent Lon protease
MEIIDISGYTDQEKESIATKFLLPRQLKENGLKPENCLMYDSALMKIIRNYTRESGVRNLEREIGKVLRKIACTVAEKKTNGKTGKTKKEIITDDRLVEFLGEIKFRDEIAEKKSDTGIVTGLAWTELGGTILKIETTILPGKGKFILTGKLGDVMKESAQAALSYIRSHSAEFGLKKGFHETIDIHIHIPEGAIPKDGPSSGITLATAMTSALLKIPVRHTVAMTGEITLRGNVLPIGGLKEKLLAAVRSGISTVLIPEENERDLAEIPDNILKKLKVIPVSHIDDVLEKSLTKSPVKKRTLSGGRKRVGSSKKTKIAAKARGVERRS